MGFVRSERLKRENCVLKIRETEMASTIDTLKMENSRLRAINKNVEVTLSRIFTRGQVNKLMRVDFEQKSSVKKRWTEADIASSITLYSTSAKAYKLLRKKQFPLPSIRTLQRWAERLDISSGILQPAVKLLSATSQMSNIQKLCVLSFDEMKVKKRYCYDKPTDSTLAPVNFVQVAMLRGKLVENTAFKFLMNMLYRFSFQMETTHLL